MMPTVIPGSDPPPGGAYSVYDFFFDTAKDTWRLWTELIDTKPIPADAKFRCGHGPNAHAIHRVLPLLET
jgi:dynein heavy chain